MSLKIGTITKSKLEILEKYDKIKDNIRAQAKNEGWSDEKLIFLIEEANKHMNRELDEDDKRIAELQYQRLSIPKPEENKSTKSRPVQRSFASVPGVSILAIGIFIMFGITALFPPSSRGENEPPVNKTSVVLVEPKPKEEKKETGEFVASKNSDKFHRKSCQYVDQIYESNIVYYKNRESAIKAGKSPCSVCMP